MKKSLSYLILLLFVSEHVLAETESDVVKANELSAIKILLPMLVVVSLIFVLAWLVKRLNPRLPAIGKYIEILSSTPVSNQSRLTLVRIGGKDLLIGITPTNITLLKDYDTPVIDKTSDQQQADLAGQFKKLLRSTSEREKKDVQTKT